MKTAVDSNVLIGLWNEDDTLNSEAKRGLMAASRRGQLVIAAPVYLEVRALPTRTERVIDSFLRESRIEVDWQIGEDMWRHAANASHEYGRRRREQSQVALPRRIAADFVIGAHALLLGFPLLTFDKRTFRTSFPSLKFCPESS